MLIRRFIPADAPALAALFHASVRRAGLRHYSPAQVAAWSPVSPQEADYCQKAQARTILVVQAMDGIILGYGDLEPDGHIDHLYCHPDMTGQRIGTAIYRQIEELARTAGLQTLFVEASEGAHRLFARNGFSLVERRLFRFNGVGLHNYRMVKTLA